MMNRGTARDHAFAMVDAVNCTDCTSEVSFPCETEVDSYRVTVRDPLGEVVRVFWFHYDEEKI